MPHHQKRMLPTGNVNMFSGKRDYMEEKERKPVSAAQRRATQKYLEGFDDLRIRIPKGQKEVVTARASENGESVNAYVWRLIREDMGI